MVFYLSNGGPIGATLVDARRKVHDLVELVIHSEVGQVPRADIREEERVIVEFDDDEARWPRVSALRQDFPQGLPHTNIVEPGAPPCLCIAIEPFRELRRTLTAEELVARIRRWLERTATGTLHQTDQQVEPFFNGAGGAVIVPVALHNMDDGIVSNYSMHVCGDNFRVVAGDGAQQGKRIHVVALRTPVHVHGRICHLPQTLEQLDELVSDEQFHLIESLRHALMRLPAAQCGPEYGVSLLLRVPVARGPGSPAEAEDVRVFWLGNLGDLARNLALWEALSNGSRGVLLGANPQPGAVAIDALNVERELEAKEAAAFNGDVKYDDRFIAIGAGALGSQVLMNLARRAVRPVAIVDEDYLAPHNLARHALAGERLGYHKASALADVINGLIDDDIAIQAIPRDVTIPECREQIDATEAEFDFALDMSASVAVARSIATDARFPRTLSLFLNPLGTDLVLLAEDRHRSITLDQLEAQYLWEIVQREELAEHFGAPEYRRYSTGCRDRSSIISQNTVATLAGIGAEASLRTSRQEEAVATVWRLTNDLQIQRIDIRVSAMILKQCGEWSCFVSCSSLAYARELRRASMPNETGGILIGSFDLVAKRIYIAGFLPEPPDSESSPTSFVRGSAGVEQKLEKLAARVDGQLRYVGEWHTHPDGHSSAASNTDRSAFAELTERMKRAGYPETYLVVAENELSAIISDISSTVKE